MFLPIFRVNQMMPFEKLFVIEGAAAEDANEFPLRVMTSLYVVNEGTLVVELPIAYFTREHLLILLRLQNMKKYK